MKKTSITVVTVILILLMMSGCGPYRRLCFNGKVYIEVDADFRNKDTFAAPTAEDLVAEKGWLGNLDEKTESIDVYRLKNDPEGRILFIPKDDSFAAYVQKGTRLTRENIRGLYVLVDSVTVRENENTAVVYRNRTVSIHGDDEKMMLRYLDSLSFSGTSDEAYSMNFRVAAEFENIPLCVIIRDYETGSNRADENICRMLADNIKSQYGGSEQ